ncbi:putative disease resistance protein RGA3, partial [Morus notabilis]
MAEAFLNVLLENLNSLVQRRIGLLLGIDKEIQKFTSTLSTISAVLEDAEEKQLTDRSIKNWLQKLTDVSFQLDDVLDDCEKEAFRLGYEEEKKKWNQKVRSSLSCFNPMNVLFRYKIANKMKEIGDRLDQIASERMNFHLRETVGERREKFGLRERRQTGSIVTEPHVYGREEDKEKIVGFLLNDERNCEDLSIYSIVGLGGMGKTTLAQLAFNDERVDKHFEVKMWVCVSEDFDVKRLVKAIIESATKTGCEALDMDPLQRRLQDILKRKRFLLVLDDVWNEDQEQWDKLKYVLACGSNGASIVVTTRLKKVASFMGTVPMHYLSGLSEYDCWLLFKQRAFANQREELPNLVKIGKEIVRKCKGVPLAAKALGGLMRFKTEEHEWLSVMQSEFWNLPQDESSILPALRLSYFNLPIEQRRCFAYCAVFPKDYKIGKERLIHLWMANGLISSKRGLDAEDIGDEILDELYWRSFIQDIVKDSFDDISSFRMHDLVHDLAQSIVEDECRIVEVDDNTHLINLSKRVRHLTLSTSREKIIDIPCAESLRTFMVLSDGTFYGDYNLKFSSLRAFDAKYIWLSTPLPALLSNLKHLRNLKHLCNLKHLRYLNLSNSDIEILPGSVCSLNHLLTLDLSFCYSLHKLPKRISHLKSLRHLYIHGCRKLSHMPPHIGRLTCLKTLTAFIVNQRKGCHLDELHRLNIGGFLRINNLEEVGSPMEAISTNLSAKRNLKELELAWSTNENESQDKAEQVLEALAPSPNLKSLSILNYNGIHFPYWFSDEILGNLV